MHQKRIDRIVLGFCTKGNLADGIAIPLLPFIQADPKGILKQDGDLRTAAVHKKVLLFRYMQTTKGGRFLTAFMLLPGYQPGFVFHLADSVFAAAAFCTAVCLYMVLFRKRNYAIFSGPDCQKKPAISVKRFCYAQNPDFLKRSQRRGKTDAHRGDRKSKKAIQTWK